MNDTSLKLVKADLDRYKKNKMGANLALLGLVFECLYFMLIYGIKASLEKDGVTNTKFCSIDIGISVILTLVTLLVSFLSSEGVKGYNKKFCIVLLVLAAVQIGKIFWLPLYGYRQGLLTVNYFGIEPSTPGANNTEFALLIIYLLASAGCFIASAVISFLRSIRLEKHVKAIDAGEVDMDKVLKDIETEEEAEKMASVSAEAEIESSEPAVEAETVNGQTEAQPAEEKSDFGGDE